MHSVDEKGMQVMNVNQAEYVGLLGKRWKLDGNSHRATSRRDHYDTLLPAVYSVEQLRKQLEVGIRVQLSYYWGVCDSCNGSH